MVVLIIDRYIGLFGTCFMQVLYLGRALHTNETLCDAPKPGGQLTTRQPAEYS